MDRQNHGDVLESTEIDEHLERLTKVYMSTFNRLFPTQRLLQIILVLGATLIMKLLS